MLSVFTIVLLYLPIILLPSMNVNSQQILLESTIVRCGHDEMLEDGTPKNPLKLASSFKSHPKLDLKLYSKCRKKLLITFRVTESSEDFIPNALILIDRAKNILTHKSSRFGIPIAVKFHQEALFQKYALKYLYRVNGKMYEDVINLDNNKNYTGCNDNHDGTGSPTCGFVPGSNPKQDSGFCCSCKDHRNKVQQRGGQRCDTPNKTPQQLTSAHCLRQSQYWYNVYELGSPSLYQRINFEIFKSSQLKNGSITWHKMSGNGNGVEVDSENPMNAEGVMKVTYRPHVEGVSRSSMVLNSSSQRLLFPLPPYLNSDNSPDPEPLKGAVEDQILIVPKSLMSPHGAACDHVGTQISAFINQPNPCQQEKNACLNNQPFDLWKQDQGAHGDPKSRFRLKSYQHSYPPLIDLDGDLKVGSIYMEHYAEAPTYVDIEIPADEIVVLSQGYNAFIESVLTDTGSEGAKIVTQVMNKELVEASFAVELVQCSLNLSEDTGGAVGGVASAGEMQTSQKKILPLHAKYFYLDIHSVVINLPIYCYVVLVNEYGESVAAREVILHPHETCLCVHTCKCACGETTNLKCDRLSDENIIAAGLGFAIETAEPMESDTNSHFMQKYKWMFHWVLVFHIVLLILACCGWMRKLSRKRFKNKRGVAGYDHVDVVHDDDDLDSTSEHSGASEITLFDKKYTSNAILLEEELDSNLLSQTHSMTGDPSNSIRDSATGRVNFAEQTSGGPSMQASAVNIGSSVQSTIATSNVADQSQTQPPTISIPRNSQKSNQGPLELENVTLERSQQGNLSQIKTFPISITSERSQQYPQSNLSQSQTISDTMTAGQSQQNQPSKMSASKTVPASVTTGQSQQKQKSSQSQTGTGTAVSSKKSMPQPSVAASKPNNKPHQQKQSNLSQGASSTIAQSAITGTVTHQSVQQSTQNQSMVSQSMTGGETTENTERSNPNPSTNLSKIHSWQQGPKAVESSDFWFKDDANSNPPVDTFINYCASTSSSKTSFGTWHRKKRDQYSAYDFLPQPTNKGSNT